MSGVTSEALREREHPLLGMPRRDAAVTALLLVATVALFVASAYHRTKAPLQRVDTAFLKDMLAIRVRGLTDVAQVMNFLGLIYVTLPVRLAIAGFLALHRRWWHVAAFAAAVIVSEATIGPLKVLYHRSRPPHPLVHISGGSFPSGHAVAASVTAVAAVIALFPEGPRRYAWGVAAVAFSVLMALSRAYLAAHWLSDAMAGVLLGTSTALVTALVVHRLRSIIERRHPTHDPPTGVTVPVPDPR